MPQRAVGEIGALERSFNPWPLAEASRDELVGLGHSSGYSAGLSTVRRRLSGAGRELSREATVAGISCPQFRREGDGDAVERHLGPPTRCHLGQQQV
jgi:hypothetical protein